MSSIINITNKATMTDVPHLGPWVESSVGRLQRSQSLQPSSFSRIGAMPNDDASSQQLAKQIFPIPRRWDTQSSFLSILPSVPMHQEYVTTIRLPATAMPR